MAGLFLIACAATAAVSMACLGCSRTSPPRAIDLAAIQGRRHRQCAGRGVGYSLPGELADVSMYGKLAG